LLEPPDDRLEDVYALAARVVRETMAARAAKKRPKKRKAEEAELPDTWPELGEGAATPYARREDDGHVFVDLVALEQDLLGQDEGRDDAVV